MKTTTWQSAQCGASCNATEVDSDEVEVASELATRRSGAQFGRNHGSGSGIAQGMARVSQMQSRGGKHKTGIQFIHVGGSADRQVHRRSSALPHRCHVCPWDPWSKFHVVSRGVINIDACNEVASRHRQAQCNSGGTVVHRCPSRGGF